MCTVMASQIAKFELKLKVAVAFNNLGGALQIVGNGFT